MLNEQAFLDFCYWIREREGVRQRKESGAPKPWSQDDIFNRYHFCNVRREDDRGTKEIREIAQTISAPFLPGFYTMARLFNHAPTVLVCTTKGWQEVRNRREAGQKIFHTAYVVTTCGAKGDKVDYVQRVVKDVKKLEVPSYACWAAFNVLRTVPGLGSFLAGQVIADLKNDRYLIDTPDWRTFAVMGPGSKKGLNMLFGYGTTEKNFETRLQELTDALPDDIKEMDIHAQDLQNCLCEFSKFMRYKYDLPGRRRVYGNH